VSFLGFAQWRSLARRRGAAGSLNGSGGDMPAFHDHRPLTINFRPFTDHTSGNLDEHNPNFNKIFQCDDCAGRIDGGDFISVLDAIQTEGFNPIWEEWQIHFIPPHRPEQFFSDDEVFAARDAGKTTRADTEEFYRCSVVGPKK
jgi:hypothetical protein